MVKQTEKKIHIVSVRLDDETRSWLGKLAKETGNTPSGLAEHLIQIGRLVLAKTGDDPRISVVKETLAEYETQPKGRNTS